MSKTIDIRQKARKDLQIWFNGIVIKERNRLSKVMPSMPIEFIEDIVNHKCNLVAEKMFNLSMM
ncbi:hypothetical protein LCGC14_1505530 [marine sediment metagenome]|uniref:Uncharacterized protein n=1 Tax=marine sediment metagenome TaxID=412755 RepID=A0A0F9J387_9ZZZZ